MPQASTDTGEKPSRRSAMARQDLPWNVPPTDNILRYTEIWLRLRNPIVRESWAKILRGS